MAVENVPPSPLPVIDENGLTLPMFVEVQSWLQTAFREIYGQDIYIENDAQDGQLIGVVSKALHDAYSCIGAAYNAFSPTTAQGVGLSRVVKINGLRRKVASKSTADLRIVGWAGTQIIDGIVQDILGQAWLLPSEVVIPPEAELMVTATASNPGEVRAAAHTINRIATITKGWQTADNPEAATVGMPIEDDPQLRVRQSISTALPARSAFESLVGAAAAIPGVSRYRGYENENSGVNERGLPQNSVAIVLEGGDVAEIAATLYRKKTPGTVTWGTDYGTYIDFDGIPHRVYFSRPVQVPVSISIPIKPLSRFTTTKETAIKQAVAAWVNAHPIGENVAVEEIATPARLITLQYPEGDPTFRIKPPVRCALKGQAPIEEDIEIAFNERPTCTVADVTIVIQPWSQNISNNEP
jgi:uncharacterized phage protein gp47/JayE